jgi:DNA-binding NarL/FixJ family response regulator
MSDLRILILADDPLARSGLALIAQTGLVVAGMEHSGVDLLAALDLHRPDAILWDIGWDPSQAAVRAISRRLSGLAAVLPPVVVLAPEQPGVDLAGQMRQAGARGVLLRSARTEVLSTALRAAAEGLVVLDPTLLSALPPVMEPPEQAPAEALTPREREVLRLLAEGLANKQIAKRLGVSEHTVKFHLNAIMGKLGAESRTEAVVRATRAGLILL